MENDFETGFEAFLLSERYDRAEDALFRVVRAAYLAGWTDAGGEVPTIREEERPYLPLTKALETVAAETRRRSAHLMEKEQDKEKE